MTCPASPNRNAPPATGTGRKTDPSQSGLCRTGRVAAANPGACALFYRVGRRAIRTWKEPRPEGSIRAAAPVIRWRVRNLSKVSPARA